MKLSNVNNGPSDDVMRILLGFRPSKPFKPFKSFVELYLKRAVGGVWK